MRISDADRQRVVDELGRHFSSGRLDMDDYAARVEEVHAAETLADLDHARRDLPFMRIGDPAGGRRALGPGRAATGSRAGAARWRARAVVLLTLLLVVVGVVVAFTVQILGIVVLAAGWAIGILQGRASHSRR